MQSKKRPPDHSYLFSGMTDAEFAEEGVKLVESERERADSVPDDEDEPAEESDNLK